MTALVHPSTTARRSTPVEIAPDIDWLDRVTGRAAVDPSYRELLLSQPAAALKGEELPVALLAALARIQARDLSEYARLAIETDGAYRILTRAGPLEEPVEVRDRAGYEPVGAAA
jgi:hypothetical protein